MKISIEDKLFLTRHLSTMIKAGVPMDDALETVADQAPPDLAKLLKKVKTEVDNGTSLGDSFAKYPKVFDRFFISLVRAGEVLGTLDGYSKSIRVTATRTTSVTVNSWIEI